MDYPKLRIILMPPRFQQKGLFYPLVVVLPDTALQTTLTAERKVGAIISSDVMLTVSTQTLLCPKLSAKKNVSNGKKMHQMARVV